MIQSDAPKTRKLGEPIEYFLRLSILSMLIRLPILIFGITGAIDALRDEILLEGYEKKIHVKYDPEYNEYFEKLSSNKSRRENPLDEARLEQLVRSIHKSETELKAIAKQQIATAVKVVSGILFVVHGCTGFRNRRWEKIQSFGFLRVITKGTSLLPKVMFLRLRVMLLFPALRSFVFFRELLRWLLRFRDGENNPLKQKLDSIGMGVIAFVFRILVGGIGDSVEECKTAIEEIEKQQAKNDDPEILASFTATCQVGATRFIYSIREVYFNPMIFGAVILLATAEIYLTEKQDLVEPGWSALLGIGTSLVAWHMTRLYERNSEKERLKILVLTLLEMDGVEDLMLAQMGVLCGLLSPNLAMHLWSIEIEYRSTKTRDVRRKLQREIARWV